MAWGQDPTLPGAGMDAVVGAQLAGTAVRLAGVASSGGTDRGVALLEGAEGEKSLVRPGDVFPLRVGGMNLRFAVEEVSERGVGLRSESGTNRLAVRAAVMRPGLGAGEEVPGPEAGGDGSPLLRYVEFNGVDAGTALRMIADQSGRNATATPAAAAVPVWLQLRDATAAEAVEEICRANGLWCQPSRDARSTLRVMTMEEFQVNLEGYQQTELSESFELLHSTAAEAAAAIYGVYGGRVRLFLGDSELLDDELDDLSRRFERFNLLTGGDSGLMGDFHLGDAGSGAGARGGRGGVYGVNGNGDWTELGTPKAGGSGTSGAMSDRVRGGLAAALAEGDGEKAGALAAEARGVPPSIFATVSRRNNLLIVRTTDPRAMEDIRRLVESLDRPTRMVLLDVKIAEVSLDDNLKSVFDFTGEGGFHYDGPHEGSWKAAYPASALLEKGLTFNLITEQVAARMQLLEERGKAKIVATPSLLTVNNEVSRLFMGKEVPIVRNVTSQTVVTEKNVVTTPETEIEFEKVGTLLLITPNVNSNGTVTLRMLQERSGLAAEKGSIPLVNPESGEIQYFEVDVVESRSVSGTFVAQDGQTVAIGGMVKEEESDVRSGVPLLMDIPVLGWLFRTTERVKSRSELVVFVTPHVMAGAEEGAEGTRRYGEANLRTDEAREAAGLEPVEKTGALSATGKEWKAVLMPGERE